MRALRYERFAPVSQVARWADLPDPAPGPGQVRVRIAWASINPLDWKLIEGQFRAFARSRPPCGIGAEFSGVVDALGPCVAGPAVGSRVLGFINPFKQAPGVLQTLAVVPAAGVVALPDGIDLDAAATLPVAGRSALQMCRLARVTAGQRVLVHGAAGGVGSFAVQVVRALGAAAFATGRSASQDFIRALGPHQQFDYTRQPVAAWVEAAAGRFDAVLDCASTLTAADVARLLPRYLGSLPRFPGLLLDPLRNPFRRRKRHALQLAPNRADLETLLDWLRDGCVAPRITRRFSAAEARDALELSKTGRARGKLLVRLSDGT